MILRPYQDDIVRAVQEHLRSVRSTLVVAATGLGKTVCFSHLADQWTSGIVLVLAHREELVMQAADKIDRVTGKAPRVQMGALGKDAVQILPQDRYVVGSVQTMSRRNRLSKINPSDVTLIIVDEAHHYVPGSQYQTVIDYFPRAKVVGFTATPRRHDQRALGQVFESCAYQYEIAQAVEDAWLVPVRQSIVRCENLDFSKVRTTAGDLNEGDLERILTEEKCLHEVAAPTVEIAKDRSALVFCVSVHHATLMAEILNRYSSSEAVVLHGETDREERKREIERFKRGDIQYLCNCGLFLEGFDAPQTSLIVMARPTKSLSLYTQIMGRGTRALPGTIEGLETAEERKQAIAASQKPDMLMLDFAGNAGRHKLVTAADVLGGRYDDEVREHAKLKALENEGAIDEQLEDSRMEVAAESAQSLYMDKLQQSLTEVLADLDESDRANARDRIKADARFRLVDVSPFDDADTVYHRTTGKATPKDPATEKQVRYLKFLGVPEDISRGYSKRQAGAVISSIKARA